MPAFARFRLYTHELDEAEQALATRALEHFHDVQDLVTIERAGERHLPLVLGRVDCAALADDDQPQVPEITLSHRGLSDRWFGHTWGCRSVITAADWGIAIGGKTDAPPTAPDAYILQELTSAVLLASGGLPETEVAHDETTGCLADMCIDKRDMAFKLRAGYLCPRCRETASGTGISGVYLDAIQNLLDRARLLALGRTPQRKRPAASDLEDRRFLERSRTPKGFTTPGKLREALRASTVTVIVGSGLSLQGDVVVEYPEHTGWTALPGWREVSTRLAHRLKEYRGMAHQPLEPQTFEEFLIELDLLRVRLGLEQYYSRAIFDIFLPVIRETGLANRLVFHLQPRWVLTTNYDFVLNYAAPIGTPTYTWKEARQAGEYLERARGPKPLLKLHGCASRPDSMVLSSREYDELRRDDKYKALVQRIFDRQIVLFLGFGLNDPLDLDLALASANLAGAAQGDKFALIHESGVAAVREKLKNVHVIPYRDHVDVPSILATFVREASGEQASR